MIVRRPRRGAPPPTGQRDNGTPGQRDNGTTGHRANGTPGQRDNGIPGQRDPGPTGHRANGTTGQRDAGKRPSQPGEPTGNDQEQEKLQGKHAWGQQARQPSNKTRRRMARERRRACYSVVSSIKDIVGESFIEDDADDQQKGDRNAMSNFKQK